MDLTFAVIALYERNFEKAYPILRNAAEQGNADGCYYLGKMYWLGDYVQQSDNYAFHLMKKAALKNHRKALRIISYMYANGEGCKASGRKAIHFLTKAARCGCHASAVDLAEHYKIGDIVNKNYRFALYWLNQNKPTKSIYQKSLLKEVIEPSDIKLEQKRRRLRVALYSSYLYWKLLNYFSR